MILVFRNSTNISLQLLDRHRSWGVDVCGAPLSGNKSEPHGCLLKSSASAERPAEAVTGDPAYCNYFEENFSRAYCPIERATWEAVRRVVTRGDTVLEIGARYATTSCQVAAAQNNSGRLISVEPDPVVWAAAEFNKLTHNCAGYSLLGILGPRDVWVEEGSAGLLGYNRRPVAGAGQGPGMVRVRHYTWSQAEEMTGLSVNTLILDCEGCYVDFLAENFERFRDQLDKIILENDHNNVTQTQMFVQVLESFGFRKDKKATTGVLNGLGSILVFTKSE